MGGWAPAFAGARDGGGGSYFSPRTRRSAKAVGRLFSYLFIGGGMGNALTSILSQDGRGGKRGTPPDPTAVGSCFRRNDEVGVGMTWGGAGVARRGAGVAKTNPLPGRSPQPFPFAPPESPPSQSSPVKGEEVRKGGNALTPIPSHPGELCVTCQSTPPPPESPPSQSSPIKGEEVGGERGIPSP